MKTLAALLSVGCLAGCGTIKVESERVAPAELHAYMAAPGIYYGLPKTEVTLGFR